MAMNVSIRNLMTSADEADIQGLMTDIVMSAGVQSVSDLDYQVTATSPASMSVDVNRGVGYVANSGFSKGSGTTKYYRVVNSATVNVSISSNSSGNPRIDIVCIKVDTVTTPDATASNIASIVVVEGTPASSPAVPATPADHYKLAEIAVANGASSITSGNITDKRATAILTSGGSEVVNLASTQTITGSKTYSGLQALNGGWSSSGQPFVSVRRNANQSLPNATYTAFSFDVEVNDNCSGWASSPNPTRLVVPSTGVYLVVGWWAFSANATGTRIVQIRKNNLVQNQYRQQPSADGYATSSLTYIGTLSASDYCELSLYQASGGSLDVNGGMAMFRLA